MQDQENPTDTESMLVYRDSSPQQYLGPTKPTYDGFVIAMLVLQALATIAAMITLAIKLGWNFWSSGHRRRQKRSIALPLESGTELGDSTFHSDRDSTSGGPKNNSIEIGDLQESSGSTISEPRFGEDGESPL